MTGSKASNLFAFVASPNSIQAFIPDVVVINCMRVFKLLVFDSDLPELPGMGTGSAVKMAHLLSRHHHSFRY
jgi:hypothetical protein